MHQGGIGPKVSGGQDANEVDIWPRSGRISPLFKSKNALLSVGLISLVTAAAFENLAATAALGAIGAAFHTTKQLSMVLTSYLLAEIIGVVALAELAKTRGPRFSLLVGGIIFASGLVISALSPNIWFLIGARAAQGIGGGSFGSVAYIVINDHYSREARPRIFFAFSMAWVAPSLIAPALAGYVANRFGWQWVFLIVVPLAVTATIITQFALRHNRNVRSATKKSSQPLIRIGNSVLLALSVFVGLRALSEIPNYAWLIAVVPAGAVAAYALWHIVPAGSFSFAPGVGSVVLLRFLSSMAFFGVDGYLPLALFQDRGFSLTMAGATLTGASLTWSAGSYWHSRHTAVGARAKIFRLGTAIAAIGMLASVIALGFASISGWIIVATWSTVALGMGMSYVSISVALLDVSPREHLEESTAATSLADLLGIAVGTGISGGLIALAFTTSTRFGVTDGLWLDGVFSFALLVLCYIFAANIDHSPSLPGFTQA